MPRLLRSEEAAREIGVTRQHLALLVREGKIAASLGTRRRYLFDPVDIALFKKKYPTDSNPLPMKGSR